MIKKYNDYKCLAPFRRRQCHCCCYPAYQSCWLIIPLWWHQFYGLWNASQCFHNAIQLGYSIHHWAGESLLIGWRADCHSPAEEGRGFWRSGHSDYGKRDGGLWWCTVQGAPQRYQTSHLYRLHRHIQSEYRRWHALCWRVTGSVWEVEFKVEGGCFVVGISLIQ